ncbi:cupredoxin domain-containing protein [Photobacterium lipolyticum]|uniref:Copper-binding protein n=1 Tax=Photobacterium lipolyticum TaxID=266810 RepID=A0A2T3N2X7_9GAMM|nr:cupredoxin family protein [Photobacterium lipolyticum]PSW06691.1 copper-binding protein [Photobacterium lipolyticum]
MKLLNTLALAIALSAVPALADNSGHDHKSMSHGDMGHSDMGHGEMGHVMSEVGMPAKTAQAIQTVNVTLTDEMKLRFDQPLKIKQGDTVRFIVTNKGTMPHEFAIGSKQEQLKHREMMRSMPNMEHNDGSVLSLGAGKQGELTWHFMGKSHVEFACNVPGHAEAGMTMDYMLRNQ